MFKIAAEHKSKFISTEKSPSDIIFQNCAQTDSNLLKVTIIIHLMSRHKFRIKNTQLYQPPE